VCAYGIGKSREWDEGGGETGVLQQLQFCGSIRRQLFLAAKRFQDSLNSLNHCARFKQIVNSCAGEFVFLAVVGRRI